MNISTGMSLPLIVSLSPRLLSNNTSTFQVVANTSANTNLTTALHPPGYTHAVTSLGFQILFPIVLILLLLYHAFARLIGTRDMVESSKNYLQDFGMVVVLAGIIAAFGFDLFYNILNLGWFYNECYRMYAEFRADIWGIYLTSTLLQAFTDAIVETLKAISNIKGEFTILGFGATGRAPNIVFLLQLSITPLSSISHLLGRLQGFAAEGYALCTLIIMLLRYSQMVSIPFLIPLGVLFRAFPFTRSVGAVLLALGIGFGFVFPIVTYALTYSAQYYMYHTPIQTPAGEMTLQQAKHYSMSLSPSDFISCAVNFLRFRKGCPAVQKVHTFVQIQETELINLLFFIHLIPLMSLAVTVVGIMGMTMYFGGERLKMRVPFRLW